MKKRITSFVMALIMLVSLLPLEAIALTTDENGVSVFEMGDSVWAKAGETPAGATEEGAAWYQVYDENDNVVTKQGLCDKTEHTHNYNCVDCTAAHTHTDECYTTVYGCGLEANAGHAHGNACYEKVCTLEETVGHVHGETCSDANGNLTCTVAEGTGAHAHVAECYNLEKLVCTTEIGAGAHAHTEECAPATSLTCEIAEHVCVTDGCAADCAVAEHTHTAECDMETTYVKWEVTAQMMTLAAEDELATAAATGLPIHFFIAYPGEAIDPNGTYAPYKQDLWGSNRGTAGAYAVAGAEDNSNISSTMGIRNANDESAVTQYVAQWPAGYDAESFKNFGTITLDKTYSQDDYAIEWVTICHRGTRGLQCYCPYRYNRNYEHIHIDGILSKQIKPAEINIIDKAISVASNEDETFTFTLQKLMLNSELKPTSEIDGNFGSVSMTATIPAGQLKADLVATSDREIGFGYYKLSEVTRDDWKAHKITINGNDADADDLYIQLAPDGTLKYATSYNGTYTTAKSIVITNVPKVPGETKPATVTVKKTDGKNLLDGAEFALYAADGTLVAGPVGTTNGVVTFTVNAAGNYVVKETKAPAGYKLDGEGKNIEVTVDKTVAEYNAAKNVYEVNTYLNNPGELVVVNEKIPGELTITKVFQGDLTDKDVTITITGPDGYNQTFTLNAANNSKTLPNLELGTYTIAETNAEADGYTLKADYQTSVELTDAASTASVTITNAYTMKTTEQYVPVDLTFNKVNDSKEALPGATFQLVGQTATKTAVSDGNGKVTFTALPMGEYTLSETAAPEGYTKDSTEYKFSVVADTENASEPVYDPELKMFVITIPTKIEGLRLNAEGVVNTKITREVVVKPDLTVVKQDQDGNALAGAEFTLSKDGAEVGKKTAGTATFKELEPGSYTLKETDAPYGYTAAADVTFTVVVDTDEANTYTDKLVDGAYETKTTYKIVGLTNNTAVVKNTEILGSLKVTKEFEGIDEADKPAITVTVTGPSGEKTVTLNKENGWSDTLTGLKLGEYTIVEGVATAAGYNLTGTDYADAKVELTETEKDKSATITNTYEKNTTDKDGVKASFQVLKVGKDNEPLDGATFTLKKGNDVVATVTTGENGVAAFNNLTGGANGAAAEYTLEETAAPAGYTKDNTKWTVTVQDDDGEPVIELNEKENVFENIWDWVVGNVDPDSTWDGETLTLVVENTKNEETLTSEYPTLTVKKVDQDGNALAGAQFTVTGPSDFSATPNATPENGLVGIKLPLPGEYTLVETDAPYGYTGDTTEYKFSVIVDEEKSYENVLNEETNKFESQTFYKIEGLELTNDCLVVENTEILGSLTITKEFKGLDEGHRPEAITVEVMGIGDYENTVELNAENEWTVTLDGLKLGEYTVTENVDTAAVPAYELKATTYAETASFELTEEAVEGEIVITNTYSKIIENVHGDTASFTVKKVDQDGNALAGATFTLTGTVDGEAYEKALTTGDNGEVKFDELTGNLEDGSKVIYTLEETTAPAGYAKTNSTWTVTVEEDGGDAKLVLKEEKGVFENIWDWIVGDTTGSTWNGETLTVINNIIKGSLTITKSFNMQPEAITEVTVTVTGPKNYSETVKLNEENKWTVTLTDLLPGDYTVTEADASVHNMVWDVAINGETGKSAIVNLPMAGTDGKAAEAVADIKNLYVFYMPTFIEIQKVGVYKGETTNLGGAEFTLYNPDGSVFATDTTTDDGTLIIGGIMESGMYTLKETAAPEGYLDNAAEYKVEVALDMFATPAPKYYVAGITGLNNEDSIVLNNDEADLNLLTVVNTPITGSITITKAFEGIDEEHMPESIDVTVTGPEGYTDTFTLTGENWTHTEDNLLPGTYTVTEVSGSGVVAGYELSCEAVEVTLEGNDTKTAALVNVYDKQEDYDATPAAFNIFKVNADGEGLAGAVFTLEAVDGAEDKAVSATTDENGMASFTDLYGNDDGTAVTFVLTEVTPPSGYHLPEDNTWEIQVVEDDGEYRIVEPTEDSNIFVNFWDWIIGKESEGIWGGLNGAQEIPVLTITNEQTELTIDKEFAYMLDGKAAEKSDKMEIGTVFNFKITYGDENEYKKGVINLGDDDETNDTLTVYGIPVGAPITIEELNTAENVTYAVTGDLKMPASGVAKATVTNTYSYYTVAAEKIVEINTNGIDVDASFEKAWTEQEYTVGLVIGDKMVDQMQITVEDGVKYFDYILPVGTEYEVVELVAENALFEASYEVADDVTTVTNTYTFVKGVGLEINMLKTDSAKKTKVLGGAKFSLYNSENDLMDTYVSAKDGTFVIDAIELPGTYTLKETQAPSGYYKLDKAVTIEIGEMYTATTGPDGEPIIVWDLVVESVKNGKVNEIKDENGFVIAYRVKNVEITDNAKTGDQMNLVLWVGMGGAAAAALVILLILGKKRAR